MQQIFTLFWGIIAIFVLCIGTLFEIQLINGSFTVLFLGVFFWSGFTLKHVKMKNYFYSCFSEVKLLFSSSSTITHIYIYPKWSKKNLVIYELNFRGYAHQFIFPPAMDVFFWNQRIQEHNIKPKPAITVLL
jgi:hypothetical protein